MSRSAPHACMEAVKYEPRFHPQSPPVILEKDRAKKTTRTRCLSQGVTTRKYFSCLEVRPLKCPRWSHKQYLRGKLLAIAWEGEKVQEKGRIAFTIFLYRNILINVAFFKIRRYISLHRAITRTY